MKCSTILLLSFLVGRFFAGYCKSNQVINITLLRDLYEASLKNISIPSIEYGDNATRFKEDYVTISSDYGQSLMIIAYDRGLEVGNELIKAIQKRSRTLHKCIKSIENRKEYQKPCADADLKNLTEQLHRFLDLNPGNMIIKCQPAPELSKKLRYVNDESKPRKRTPADIFLNLARILNDDFDKIYKNVARIRMIGWFAARSKHEIVQLQFRNQILNGPVMKAYRHAVDKVLKSKTRYYVDPETWKYFEDAADRIIEISNDYEW